MSVYTDFDRDKDNLREELNNCLYLAKELMLDEEIMGYNEDEATAIYFAVKKARDTI